MLYAVFLKTNISGIYCAESVHYCLFSLFQTKANAGMEEYKNTRSKEWYIFLRFKLTAFGCSLYFGIYPKCVKYHLSNISCKFNYLHLFLLLLLMCLHINNVTSFVSVCEVMFVSYVCDCECASICLKRLEDVVIQAKASCLAYTQRQQREVNCGYTCGWGRGGGMNQMAWHTGGWHGVWRG